MTTLLPKHKADAKAKRDAEKEKAKQKRMEATKASKAADLEYKRQLAVGFQPAAAIEQAAGGVVIEELGAAAMDEE